jgi:predicted lipoprotein
VSAPGRACSALALGGLLGCSPVALGDGPRRVIVTGLADTVIVPTLDEVSTRAGELRAALEPVAAQPSLENLRASQSAWREARAPWKETEAFAFGPAMQLRLGVAIDQSPVDTDKIDEELASTIPIDQSYIDDLGANRKGFHALEYLLFGSGDEQQVLAQLTSAPQAERHRALVLALGQNLESTAGELLGAWQADGGNYVGVLTQPGAANASYTTVKSVIDTFVNESIFLSELVANNKLGKPLGSDSGGDPRPELEESGPSDNSLADMANNLRSIRNVYFGTRSGVPGSGIDQLVSAQSPATNRAVIEALEAAIRAVEAIPTPYRTALLEQRPEVDAAFEAVKALKRVLATEVVGVLGATLKFNDTDGD